MFPKILAFGIGALALVQGALAIAPGRYIITNPEFGTLVSFRKGDPIVLDRAPPFPPQAGQWTVNEIGQDVYTITNADASVYANEDTLFTGDRFDIFLIQDAGNDLFVIKATDNDHVWTGGNIDDARIFLCAMKHEIISIQTKIAGNVDVDDEPINDIGKRVINQVLRPHLSDHPRRARPSTRDGRAVDRAVPPNHSTGRFKTARAVKKHSIRPPCPSRARAAALVSGGWINGLCPSMDPDSTHRRECQYLDHRWSPRQDPAAHYPAEQPNQSSTLATPPEFPASRSRL
ncbi:hypothetical protein B0H14DRAFT_2573537 [Mycena olivaceomarginata]|nr:hypothetical protein B0H14DRAFT_2573537 [Mycena olivaceomarginata]